MGESWVTSRQEFKLLTVFPDPPWRGGSGSHMRDLEHLYSLVEVGLEPTVLCFVGSAPPPAPPSWVTRRVHLLPFVRRPDLPPAGVAAAVGRGLGYLTRDLPPLRSFSSRFAYPSTYLYDLVDALGHIERAASAHAAGAVLLRSWFLPYAKALKGSGLRVIMDAHDAQSRAAVEIFRTLPCGRRWMSLPMVIATRRMEHRYLRFCDEVWAPSDEDAACVRTISPETRCFVYPNLVPFPALSPEPDGNGGPTINHDSILFVGNMAYPPNAQAAEYLIERIVPALRRQRPEVVATVVGDGAPESVVRAGRCDPKVVVTGRVPDVSPFYHHATVVVVPVANGSGTKVKLLEALSFGKAVVTTPKGAEGIHVRHGVHLHVAERHEFAQVVVELLCDAGKRRALGTKGRALVRQEYAFDLGPRILSAHSILLADNNGRAA